MKWIELERELIRGAISIERQEQGIKPWRLPFDQIKLFYPQLAKSSEVTAGVRIAFLSDSSAVQLQWVPTAQAMILDLVIEDQLIQSVSLDANDDVCLFEGLPREMKRMEIYLSQRCPITLTSLHIDDEATLVPVTHKRPRWVTYGSSITQCMSRAAEAESPAQTWPAIVARSKGWDLTCLGFGGQCHIDSLVARVIRDLPAEVISLCLGINVQSENSLSTRTFRSSVIGMVSIIREKHIDTPLYLFSPIYCPQRETTVNQVGLNLVIMREEIREAVRILESYGDRHLFYVDGLEIFGQEHAAYLPDNLHPDAEGYKIMARNIMPRLQVAAEQGQSRA